jgi:hypothetical protein
VIPAIIRATEAISKSFGKYLDNISGKHDIQEKQSYWALRTYSRITDVKAHNVYHGK